LAGGTGIGLSIDTIISELQGLILAIVDTLIATNAFGGQIYNIYFKINSFRIVAPVTV
jgi:hypothetical protein